MEKDTWISNYTPDMTQHLDAVAKAAETAAYQQSQQEAARRAFAAQAESDKDWGRNYLNWKYSREVAAKDLYLAQTEAIEKFAEDFESPCRQGMGRTRQGSCDKPTKPAVLVSRKRKEAALAARFAMDRAMVD